ncbi:MAG: hypothetical protein KJO81_09460 [Gammaproteobacteria bacterium]|nr:hypothetical protein [Gammaproteobacteria bacterium]NNC68688.1 NAD(P)-dependent oxidoreductase [Gammaproteobacteria bacterium]
MELDNSEIIKIGIVGEGSLTDLFVEYFINAGVSLNLLESAIDIDTRTSNVYYHNSLFSIAKHSSIIVTMMPDGPALEKILFDEDGISNHLSQGSVIIDMSSVSPELIQEISEQLIEQEVHFLDAALINEAQSESDLMQMMLIGGDSHAYNQVLPVFQRIIKDVKHLGANGASQFYRQAFAVRAKNA